MKPQIASSRFSAAVQAQFAAFVADPSFPCLGAKAALNAGSYRLCTYDKLASAETSAQLYRDLVAFTGADAVRTQPYASFIAIFGAPMSLGERAFEELLWLQLHRTPKRHGALYPIKIQTTRGPRCSCESHRSDWSHGSRDRAAHPLR